MSESYPKKKYILIVHEAGDDTAYVGNALYLVSSDKNGGWNDLQTRLSLGNLKFKGETAPKKESQLLEKLRWKHSEIVKNGYSCVLPSCITFSQFISEMTTSGRIPSQPTTSFPTAESDEPEIVEQAPSNVQSVFESQVDEELMIGDDSTLHEESGASIEYPREDGHNGLEETVPKKAYNALKKKFDTVVVKADELEGKYNDAVNKVIDLENKNAIGQTDQASIISRNIKGFLEDRIKTLSSSMEHTVRREVHSALADLGTDHISGMHEKLASTESIAMDNQSGLRAVVSAQETQQVSLDILVQNSKFMKARAIATPNTSTPAKPSASISLNDSGFSGENWRSNPPPLRCNFCGIVGHGWRTCRQRPTNYRCGKCLSPEHKEANCAPSKNPCEQCHLVGHTKAVHALTDPQKRLDAIMKFGPEPFRHWSANTEENSWSSSPRKKPRNQ